MSGPDESGRQSAVSEPGQVDYDVHLSSEQQYGGLMGPVLDVVQRAGSIAQTFRTMAPLWRNGPVCAQSSVLLRYPLQPTRRGDQVQRRAWRRAEPQLRQPAGGGWRRPSPRCSAAAPGRRGSCARRPPGPADVHGAWTAGAPATEGAEVTAS